MRWSKYFNRKFVACLIYTLTVVFGIFPHTSASTVQLHLITDVEFNRQLTKIEGHINTFATETAETALKSSKTALLSDNIEQYMQNMGNNIKQYYQEIDKWQKLTEPNLAYPKLIERLNTDLINEGSSLDTKLALLKQNLFSNTATLLNTADQYSQDNPVYALAIGAKSMCPNPATKLIPMPHNDSYGKLHQDSCLVIYNLRAYKKFVNTEIRKKHDLIDKMTKNILLLPDKTMGDHNARKDALMSVQLLREKMMYEHRVNMEEVDARIKIADRTRVYSGAAMVGGAPTNPGLTAASTVIKTGLGGLFTLSNLIPNTPYNQ